MALYKPVYTPNPEYTCPEAQYAVRAMADETCSSIDEAVERFKYMELHHHARVVAWLEGLHIQIPRNIASFCHQPCSMLAAVYVNSLKAF